MKRAIFRRLQKQGPVHALLSEDEYLYLKRRFRKIWLLANQHYWSEDERLIALGYLRGYTLFREIPENDRQFWGPFLEELGVAQEQPSRREFDELWDALRSHPETNEYLVIRNDRRNERRMLAQTIDRIWGVKGLRAGPFSELLKEFLRLREVGEKPDVKAMLLRWPEHEYIHRHADTYERIFEGIAVLLDALQEEPEFAWSYFVGEVTEEEFIKTLQRMGLFFSRPHPFAYVRNKSERLLRELLVAYVKFGAPASKPKTRGAKAARTGVRRLVEVQLLSEKGLVNLPGLEGLEIIPDIKHRAVLKEGRRVTGEARVSSGSLAPCKFHWRPELDESGNPVWVRPEEEVVLGFGDNEIRIEFELLPKNVLRLELTGYEGALDWNERNQFKAKLAGGIRAGYVQFRLASQEEIACKDLDELLPLSSDALWVEYVYQGEAFRLDSEPIPVRFTPRLVSWEAFRNPHGVEVRVEAELPRDGLVSVLINTGKELQREELSANSSNEYLFQFQVDPLTPVTIELALGPGEIKDNKYLPPKIDWKRAFSKGVALGAFSAGEGE